MLALVSLITSVLLAWAVPPAAALCPDYVKECTCTGENVRCYNLGLTNVPRVPPSTILLDLRYNNIKKLSNNDFSRLTSLRTLLLQDNQIEQIDSIAFQPLANLELLYLSDNSIKELSLNLFIFLRKVRIIHLDKNKISHVDEGAFNGLPSLTTIHLQSNNISLVGGRTFSSLDKLETLRLDGNPLLCNCQLGWAINYAPLDGEKSSLKCAQPINLHGQLVRNMKPGELGCSAPSATIASDHVTIASDHFNITTKQDLRLHCIVTGKPHPLITWTHDSVNISNNSRIEVRHFYRAVVNVTS